MRFYLLPIVIFGLAGFGFLARTQQAAPVQQVAQQAAAPLGWQEVKSTDWVREPRRQFTLPGRFLAPLPTKLEGNPGSAPALLLKCAVPRRSGGEGKFRVGAVVVGTLLKIHMVEPQEIKGGPSYYPEVALSYRFDDGKPLEDDWPPRYDKISVEFDKPTFKKILHAHTMLVTLPDKNGHEVRMQFDLPEFPSASAPPTAVPVTSESLPAARTAAQIAEACGVEER